MGFYLDFIGPGGWRCELFCPEDGEFAHQKICQGVLPEGWSCLELTDTLDS